jgi:hypothetical protein
MSEITVEPLAFDQLAMVYPLVHEVVRGLDLPDWLRFARRIAAPGRAKRSGIMVALRAGQPFPCGLFCYREERDLNYGTVLIADHIITLDILDPKPILTALVAELDALATRLGCAAVQSVVRDGLHEVATGLLAAGHQLESETLAKRLTVARAARVRQ